MATGTGFGKVKARPKTSKNTAKRIEAASRYEEMKTKGMPQFNIYIRIQDKNNWYPVGSLAVNRSNQIHQAIFQNEQELLQGAFRLFPILRKHQQSLEYGFRLKEFPDEPIQLAQQPAESPVGMIQSAFRQAQRSVANLFSRNQGQ